MRYIPRGLAAFLVFLVLVPTSRAADSVRLIATNATWKYFKGTSAPSPSDTTAWRKVGFADQGWLEGPATFWFGEADTFGGTGTELTDMQNRYSSLYLRKTFSLVDPSALLSVNLDTICDDGFIAWINGQRIVNRGGPAGEPSFNSFATVVATEPVRFVASALPDPVTLLVPGENVLAVQVFNTSLGSSDLVFDAELIAVPRTAGPPVITAVTPPPGPIKELTRITVTFNESVQGIRADDFLMNGIGAASVVGSGTTYTFGFTQPAYGPVGISWSTFHTIQDFENPPQRFEIAAPGSTWAYELLDPSGPALSRIQPPPDATLRTLREVEITFDKAVTGVDPGDLLAGSIAATNVTGVGAGPYRFQFPASAGGNEIQVRWAAEHGIVSDALEPHAFSSSGPWTYRIQPSLTPPALRITEFMAENLTSYRDEEEDPEDWIEILNPTADAVNLAGWSLSNSDDDPGRWVCPEIILGPGQYLVVFASGKDRAPAQGTGRLHTNFKLNPSGDYLGLYSPELPRVAVDAFEFEAQGPDYSLGREPGTGDWRFFKNGTPGTVNGTSDIFESVADVRFSVERGFFAHPFDLYLSSPTPGAQIRYTTNGSPPTEVQGFVYTNSIPITGNRVIRAAAFKTNAMPSRVATHTYLMNLSSTRLRLPALSLVTATNNLYGRTGIMEVSPRNTTKRGAAWERPVSAEFIRVDDNSGFQVDCGLRLQGGDYVRGQYNYRSTALPFSKYSFRLYFRGEYGSGRLEYPLFPGTTQESFDTIVLRAGMNDHSNPYLLDEYVRTLARNSGQPSALGTFVHLFLNGVYKGYYNPCERIDADFLRAYHGGGEAWDIIAQLGEIQEGDATAWNSLRTFVNTRDLTLPDNYRQLAGRLDLTNFVDYLCPLIYVDNDDWPHNNWRAARERVPGAPFRMYVWDAEWSFGAQNGHAPTWNTIQNQLSSTSPPWGGTDIQRLFNGLKRAPEFRLLFADRVHRHFFNGGALTDERLRASYREVTNRLNGVVPSFDDRIGRTWIPQRRRSVLQHLERAGFLASSNAPVMNQFGGRVPSGYRLELTNLRGDIYYTTNGTDPRVAFTGEVATNAISYQTAIVLTSPHHILARSLDGTNWSALTEAGFQLGTSHPPLRITEIMYNPSGGDAFEFIELANTGTSPLDVAGFSFDGIEFRFPEPHPLMSPGARWVIANDMDPADFTARYPNVTVMGWFDGSLRNSGERIEVLDRSGKVVASVEYSDLPPWPTEPDEGQGSLELVDPRSDPSDPAAWRASPSPTGSPGQEPALVSLSMVHISEIAIRPGENSGWIELHNIGNTPVDLSYWSISDEEDPRRFVFPVGTTIGAGEWLLLYSGTNAVPPQLSVGFDLDHDGETLALYDAIGVRRDASTFGLIPQGFSLGRLGDGMAWELCEPTPSAPNEAARMGLPTQLKVNEWLANPVAGVDDWVELHNLDPELPVALRGLSLSTSNAVHWFGAHTFVPPGGFLVLKADEEPGPDHLDLRLPAAGGAITLLDSAGEVLDKIIYPASAEGISMGRIPDGTGTLEYFPNSSSPGSSNYVVSAGGPRINEWMARNSGSVIDPENGFADWIELSNPGSQTFNLEGTRVVIDSGNGEGREWTFPPNTQLSPGSFLLVWCRSDHAPSTSSSGPFWSDRSLRGEGGVLQLIASDGRILDSVRYGPQLPDRSVGRIGETLTLLQSPTPGTANLAAAPLASPSGIRINEWLAATDGDDWIELYNPAEFPVDLGEFHLTDDPSIAGSAKATLAPLSLIDSQGHQIWIADDSENREPDHLPFQLSSLGESLRLYNTSRSLVDSVDFGPQIFGVPRGRFPDGADTQVFFRESASPGRPNWLPHPGVVIQEVLAHTDPPLEDAIELYNPAAHPVDITGWWLSDDEEQLRKHTISGPAQMLPTETWVLYENEFNRAGDTNAFSLNSSRGDDVWLSEVDKDGVPTGYRAHVSFGPTANGVSLGRHRTSIGWDFAPQSRRTFGKDSPGSLSEFRQGTGLPNAYPLVGPIIISEIHYPPTSSLATGVTDEFVELANTGQSPVPLFDPAAMTNAWRLTGSIEFTFPPGQSLAPGEFVLVVGFSPTDASRVAAFRSRVSVPDAVRIFGPFVGELSNERGEVRLESTDRPQAPPDPDAGLVPYVLVERVSYSNQFPWPGEPITLGWSLQRRRALEYANDPANWIAAQPSPGSGTRPPASDRDFDGIPNDWEIAYGLNPDNPDDAGLDPDQDGIANWGEFLAGTHPLDATSHLQVRITNDSSNSALLEFRAIAGRTYRLEHRDHPAWGTWESFVDIPAASADQDIVVPLGVPASDVSRFYRLVTPALP